MKFSKFSNHFNADSGILQLMSDLGQAVNQDVEQQMLGGGNPAVIAEMESVFRAEMLAIMNNGNQFEGMINQYDAPQGSQELIKALVNLFNRIPGFVKGDRPLTEKNVAITNGSQASFAILFNLFAGEYDDGKERKILLPMTPEYIGYKDVGLSDGPLFTASKPRIDEQLEDEWFFKYRIDFDNIKIGDDIGAICVSRPTNPTGNVVTDTELNRLIEMARDAEIPLILDGAYGLPFPNIVFEDAKPVWTENIILCMSLSKLGLPGVRTGFVVAGEEVIEKITSSNAIYNLSPGRFGPALVTRLVESGELLPLCKDIVRPYYENRSEQAIKLIKEQMADLPVKIHVSEGAIFLWLWFKGLPISSDTLYRRLKKRGVFILSGHHFFPGLEEDWPHKDECIRVSYAANHDQLVNGITMIADEVRHAFDSK